MKLFSILRQESHLFSNAQKSQKKEVRDMMRKYLAIIAVVLVAVFGITGLYAHGTSSGSVVSNAVLSGSQDTNAATGYGALSGAFTNDSGSIFFAEITNTTAVTTHVDPGYDMSPLAYSNSSYTQNGSAGGTVTFPFIITNWGNTADNIVIKVTNRGDSFGGTGAFYTIYTQVSTQTFATGHNVSGTYPALAADSVLNFWVQVSIPSGAANNSTNRIFLSVEDTAGSTGDGWPGLNAIAPATSDAANTRDFQSTTALYVIVSGPVIKLSKSVDVSSARPYEDLTYTIHFTNTGSATAQKLVIQDVIPNHALLVVDSAEAAGTFHGHAESAAYSVTYLSNASWVGSGSDNATSISNISRIKWTVSSNIPQNVGGSVTFQVRIK